jgi:hypothetical protein
MWRDEAKPDELQFGLGGMRRDFVLGSSVGIVSLCMAGRRNRQIAK